MSKFVKTIDGQVHLKDVLRPDYSLCGRVSVLSVNPTDVDPDSDYFWAECDEKVVTCPHCIQAVEACQGVATDSDKVAKFAEIEKAHLADKQIPEDKKIGLRAEQIGE